MGSEATRPRPTLKDVAKLAGVSTFTVSKALSGTSGGVAEDTRSRVLQAADQLGYTANPYARSLRSGRSSTVAVLTANRGNLFYAELITAMERELRGDGYDFLVLDAVVDGEFDPDHEREFTTQALNRQAAVAVLTYRPDPENLERLRRGGVHCIFVDTDPPTGFAEYPSVRGDSAQGARLLAEHLIEHGYQGPWLFAGLPERWSSVTERYEAFRDVAERYGIDVPRVEASNLPDASQNTVAQYLDARARTGERLPRVVFAANEIILQGVLAAVRSRGLRVPFDIAVVSYDEFTWARYLDPPVAVVDQHLQQIASEASRLVRESALPGEATATGDAATRGASSLHGQRILVPPTVIPRTSCGCAAPVNGFSTTA